MWGWRSRRNCNHPRVGISTWLRPRIGYTLWKKLHVLTLLIFALATIHGLGTGSDTQTSLALGIYLVSIALVAILLFRRLFAMPKKHKRVPESTSHEYGKR